MQNRMPIIIAVAAGIVAIVLMNFQIEDVRRAAQPEWTQVVVAASELRPGHILESKDVAMAVKAKNSMPALAIKWDERNLYMGQPIRFRVTPNDYVLASYFTSEGLAAPRLSEKIDANSDQRAMTIPVNNLTSIEGAIRPGDRIDLLLTYTYVEKNAPEPAKGVPAAAVALPRLVTVPLLENAYVAMTGRYGASGPGNYSTITLLVSPDEAKMLIWALKQGELSVLLRNPKDLRFGDRTFVQGDTKLLNELGQRELRPSAVVADRKATKGTEPAAAAAAK